MEQARRWLDGLLSEHRGALEGSGTTTVLVVAHNGILRCLLLTLLGVGAAGFRRLRLDNGSISVLNLSGSPAAVAVQVESLNGTAHLGTSLPPRGEGVRLLLGATARPTGTARGASRGRSTFPSTPTASPRPRRPAGSWRT